MSEPPTLRPISLLLLLAAALLLVSAALAPLDRNQEARVLETAREMLGRPGHDWLIPRCNGEVRLQKPPLCYWMSAGSYELFGVSTFAGRLPFVACAVGLLLVTQRISLRLFDARIAGYAMAGMIATLQFQRYGKLAETDIPAAFFATVAIYAIFRAPASFRAATWHHAVSGLAIGLAVLAKGPPALLPILFLLAYAAYTRNGRLLLHWFLVAVPIAVLIAAPWFLYIRLSPESAIVREELNALVAATRHPGKFYSIPSYVLRGALPWTGFLLVGIGAAFGHVRHNRSLAVVGLWWLSFLVPLMLLPQQQDHYVIPMLPASMILIAWLLGRATAGDDPELARFAAWILGAVAIGLAAAVVVPLIGPLRAKQPPRLADLITIAILLACSVPLFLIYRKRGLAAALHAALLTTPVAIAALVNYWSASRVVPTFADVSARIRIEFPNGPYAFYPAENLRVAFHLQRVIPTARNEAQLNQFLSRDPGLLVLSEQDKKRPTTMPAGLVKVADHEMDDKHIRVYRRAE